METFMCSPRFMGRKWLVRDALDHFRSQFFSQSLMKLYEIHLFRQKLKILHLILYIHLILWIFTCLAVWRRGVAYQKVPQIDEHWWPSHLPRLLRGHHQRLWPRRCAGFVLGVAHRTGHTRFTPCPECSRVFYLPACDNWHVYAMWEIYHWKPARFFMLLSSNSVDSDNFVQYFVVHSNRTHEFLADNLMVTKHCGGTDVWYRSYLAACLGPLPISIQSQESLVMFVY